MSRLVVKYTMAAAPLLLLLSCGRHSASVNDPLPADQVAAVLQQSFESADQSSREAVRKIVDELQRQQVSAAFTDAKELASHPNLTQDQLITAIRAGKTIGQQLQNAAQSGDDQAADTLRSYKGAH